MLWILAIAAFLSEDDKSTKTTPLKKQTIKLQLSIDVNVCVNCCLSILDVPCDWWVTHA